MKAKKVFQSLLAYSESKFIIYAETIIVTAVLLGLCYWMNPRNPFYIHGIFPWPWLASVVIALKYGFGPSVLSVAIITASLIFFQMSLGTSLSSVHQSYLLSGFILTFLCAIFSSSWIRRVNSAEELEAYSEGRLNNLSRSYYMLYISYRYLEENLITKPVSLRNIMLDLQQPLIHQQGILTPEIAQRFLQITLQISAATIAAIYRYENKAFILEPLARVGDIGELNRDDPLITICKETMETSYRSITSLEDMNKSNYLIVLPMLDEKNVLKAILVVKEMPFWKLSNETLRILSILVAYFMGEVTMANLSLDVDNLRDIPPEFGLELRKLLRLKKQIDVDSALVAIMVSDELRDHNVIESLKTQQRGLDLPWQRQMDNYDVMITLMPLTNSTGIHGYLTRINKFYKSNLGLEIDQKKIKSRYLQLSDLPPKAMIEKFIDYLQAAMNE